MHDDKSTGGDPELLARVSELVTGRKSRLAAAVIDLAAEPASRFAFVGQPPDLPFEIGSITKALTGMLLADCVGADLVSLDSEVGQIATVKASSELASVSLLELATHTSGLPRMPRGIETRLRALPYAAMGLNPYFGIAPRTVVNQAARQELRERGSSNYSNLGGALLGQLLAIATETDFAALISTRIFQPLGMTNTAVSTGGDCAPWGRSRRGLPRQPWIMGGYAPAGGVHSTIDDLSRLASALLKGSAPGAKSMAPIDGINIDAPNRRSGLFWNINESAEPNGVVWHNGGTGGYSSLFGLMPNARRSVIVLESVARDHERLGRIAARLYQ